MEAALTKGTRKETLELAIPSDLDAASVVSVHAELVTLLAEASETNAVAQVDLAKSDSVSPLSLQLLASAANSFRENQVHFGATAVAALTTLETAKEI